MGAPTVPYKMSPDGFEVTSDENGFAARASFIMLWSDAFLFHDQIMGMATPLRWSFPGTGASGARLYAMSARIVPIALDEDGVAMPITAALGMAPGEFWTWARVDVGFKTPTYPQSSADDAGGSQHFNPAAPLYGCEQTVRVGTRAEPVDKAKFNYDSYTDKTPKEDPTYFKGESNLTLHWPFVAYVPWQKYNLFRNTVNSIAIFDCAIGQLLFVGADIQPAQGPEGKPGRSVTVTLAVGDDDWNKLPHPETGVLYLARYKLNTGKRLYAYKSFSDLAP